jgi:hypothetical protein
MQMSKTKKTASIALILLLTISMSVATFSTVKAASIPTYLEISAAPNPAGIGQAVYMNIFMTKPAQTSGMNGVGDLYKGLTVQITAPDGTKTVMGPYTADPTGGIGGLEFTPNQIGNYTLQASYPGQTLQTAGQYNGTIEEPSVSAVITVNVQQEPIPLYSEPPLPTEYWSRPIYATNHLWSTLGGDWLGLGTPSFATTGQYDVTGNFNPYSPAPNTAHVMWTKPTAFGGQVGGAMPGDEMHQYISTTIMSNFFEPIIISGVLYYSDFPTLNSHPESWNAVDLRTGQTLWTEPPGVTATLPTSAGGYTSAIPNSIASFEQLKMGQVVSLHSMQEYGSFSLLYSTSGTTYRLYEPFTGEYIGNITNVQGAGMLSGANYIQDTNTSNQNIGTLLGYYTSFGNLTMWNSTLCFNNGVPGAEMLRPPTTVDFIKGTQWNVTLPTKLNVLAISPALGVSRVTSDVILLSSVPLDVVQASSGYGVFAGYDAHTGAQLWIQNMTLPIHDSISVVAANNDVFVMQDKDTDQAWGYSLLTGNKLWGPVDLPGNALSHLSNQADIAYGNVYIWDIGGYVNAVNLNTGVINWTYTPPSSGYNTPYGVYPLWGFGTDSIADGKLFLSASRMYDPPMFTNGQRLALNCTDGSVVWSILSFSGRSPGAIADGFLVQWNSYDKQIYTFGKGQTDITASIQNDIITHGNSIMIKGMVTDQSPGTQQATQKADFPDGVPCVSDASMSNWMEYVYMQQPKPTNATGVPVTLSVLDANGNYREIGTTTSDLDGFYSYQWTPEITGKYTVYASFGGSESYWPSHAVTSFAVDPAAPTPTPSAPALQSVADMYFVPAVAGIIVAIAIVGALLALLLLRKRP